MLKMVFSENNLRQMDHYLVSKVYSKLVGDSIEFTAISKFAIGPQFLSTCF